MTTIAKTAQPSFYKEVEFYNYDGIQTQEMRIRKRYDKMLWNAADVQRSVYYNEGNRFYAEIAKKAQPLQEDIPYPLMDKHTEAWHRAVWRALGDFAGAFSRALVHMSYNRPRYGGIGNNITTHHHHYNNDRRQVERSDSEQKDRKKLSKGECWAAVIAGVGLAWALAKPFAQELRKYRELGQVERKLVDSRKVLQTVLSSGGHYQVEKKVDAFLHTSLKVVQNERRDFFYGTLLKSAFIAGSAVLAYGGLTASKRAAITGIATIATSVFGMLFKAGYMSTGEDNLKLVQHFECKWPKLLHTVEEEAPSTWTPESQVPDDDSFAPKFGDDILYPDLNAYAPSAPPVSDCAR